MESNRFRVRISLQTQNKRADVSGHEHYVCARSPYLFMILKYLELCDSLVLKRCCWASVWYNLSFSLTCQQMQITGTVALTKPLSVSACAYCSKTESRLADTRTIAWWEQLTGQLTWNPVTADDTETGSRSFRVSAGISTRLKFLKVLCSIVFGRCAFFWDTQKRSGWETDKLTWFRFSSGWRWVRICFCQSIYTHTHTHTHTRTPAGVASSLERRCCRWRTLPKRVCFWLTTGVRVLLHHFISFTKSMPASDIGVPTRCSAAANSSKSRALLEGCGEELLSSRLQISGLEFALRMRLIRLRVAVILSG